jgi:hypothetical protein
MVVFPEPLRPMSPIPSPPKAEKLTPRIPQFVDVPERKRAVLGVTTRRWRSKVNRIPISSARITRSDDLGELPLLNAVERHQDHQHHGADQGRVEQLPCSRRTTGEEDPAIRFEQPGERVEA